MLTPRTPHRNHRAERISDLPEAYPAGSQVYFERSIWFGYAASFGPVSVLLDNPATEPSDCAFSSQTFNAPTASFGMVVV